MDDSDPSLTLFNPVELPPVDNPEENTQRLKMEVQKLFCEAQMAANDDKNQIALPFVKSQLLRILECLNRLSTSKGEQLRQILPTVSVKGPQKLQCQPKFKRTSAIRGPNPNHEFKQVDFAQKEKTKLSLLSLKHPVKREVESVEHVPDDISSSSRIQSLPGNILQTSAPPEDSSKSFTPILGYSNIMEPLIHVTKDLVINMRSLKSLDPYLSPQECASLTFRAHRFTRGWLTEEIIDGYLHILCKSRNNSFYTPCLFMAYLFGSGKALKDVVFDKSNFLNLEFVFIPTNVTDIHWVLFVLRPRLQRIEYYDPQNNGCNGLYLEAYHKLVNFINSEILAEEKPVQWTLVNPPHAVQPSTDSMNCGPYICFFAFALLSQTSLLSVDILDFRKRIYDTIVNNCLKNISYSKTRCVICNKAIGGVKLHCINCKQFSHKNCVILKYPHVSKHGKQDFYCP